MNKFIKGLDYLDSIEHQRIGHHASELFEQCVEPDFAADIDARNGWTEPTEQSARNQRWDDAVDLLVPILHWLSCSATIHSAGLRALAFVCAIRPDLLDAQHKVAARTRVTRAAISKYVSELYRLSNGLFVRAHTCSNGARRAQLARLARQRWKRVTIKHIVRKPYANRRSVKNADPQQENC